MKAKERCRSIWQQDKQSTRIRRIPTYATFM
jgi:hypothetical protein